MKKKIIFTTVFIMSALFLVSPVFADTTIRLDIKTNTATLYNENITVSPCDSDNDPITTEIATPYCAILQTGLPNNWDWTWAPSAFLTSLNNISGYTSKDKNNDNVYHYWSWSLNSVLGESALNEYKLQPNDLISLTFIDPVDPTPTPSGGGPLVSSAPSSISTDTNKITETKSKPIFDQAKAINFLIANQKADGSFGEDIYTDWTAVALSATDGYEVNKNALKEYLTKNKTGTLLTDYERRAMALMSLGVNPYNVNDENYIEKITVNFDGKQFGDPDQDNDDVFALIVLQNAGFTADEEIITKTINFVLSKQKENGSWDESIDMTGAGIEALSAFNQNEKLKNALQKAKNFLKQNQKDNGGFGNISSTAWVMEGILALGEKPEDWIKNGNTPVDYFAQNQDTDGGMKNENLKNKIWETAYVVTALSGKTWNQIMQKFNKPQVGVMIDNKIEEGKLIKTENKKTIKIIAKDSTPINKTKLKNLATQNLAAPIAAIPNNETINPVKKENKFWGFLKMIFGF